MINELHNLGIFLQIVGILVIFPIKLIWMYCIVIEAAYNRAKQVNEMLIENQGSKIYYSFLMWKIQLKINQIIFVKTAVHLITYFSEDITKAFKPHPFLVTLGSFLVMIGLVFQLQW